MYSARVNSKACYLPELEEPTADQAATRLTLGWIEITGFGEGGVSLARMSRGKYFALVLIGVLAAMLSLQLA